MENDLLHFLKKHKIFSYVDETTLQLLIPKFTRIELAQGNILFQQGEEPGSVYILISGKLIAQLTTINNLMKTVGHIGKGETVGELSALSNEPYPYTVKAANHAILYKLPAKEFVDLCHRYPAAMLATTQPLIMRSQNIIHLLTHEEAHKQIAIIPANKTQFLGKFIEKFIPLTKSISSIILISDYSSEYNHSSLTIEAIREKIYNIEHNKKKSEKIFYLLLSSETLLAQVALKKSDMIYVVADATSPPEIDPIILEKMNNNQSITKTQFNLVLLHAESVQKPIHTSLWLQHHPFHLHHHVRIDSTRHFKRLLRFMREKAVGVVLGGGGTRGWAHLGAIKALREHKIPIDFIGGTSVGAIIGGCYSMYESYENAYENFHKIVTASRHSISARSFTLPLVSIFDGKNFTDSLNEVFDNTLIEDLWLPYFCISSNLANFSEEVHRTGLLWERARASSSIPGLIPPTVIHGEIHFDGGLLNNLPVDIMWQFIGDKGKTIAIELTSSMHDYHKYHFPPYYTLKQALLNKTGMSREIYTFPRFLDSFIRGLLLGSSAKAKLNSNTATIHVNLSLRKFRIIQFNKQQAEKMFEIGYVETISHIFQFKNRHL